jgi:hypothetical protein
LAEEKRRVKFFLVESDVTAIDVPFVTSGFTAITGVTVTGTTVNFSSGVFTTQISGALITGDAGQFNTLTGNTAGFVEFVFQDSALATFYQLKWAGS